jgi:archaellum component FlaD/FlaE
MGAPAKKVKKFVDKKIVEPLERPVKKVAKGVKNAADEVFEEVIEKPYKKVVTEVKDTVAGTDKTDRRPPKQSQTAQARTGAAREEAEEVEATVETEGVQRRRRKKGKKQLVTPAAAIAVGGEGSSGLNIPKE